MLDSFGSLVSPEEQKKLKNRPKIKKKRKFGRIQTRNVRSTHPTYRNYHKETNSKSVVDKKLMN